MATAVHSPPHMLEPSENWDDDFEFNSSSKSHPNPPSRRPARKQHAGLDDARKLSMASSAIEDWDAEPSPTLTASMPAQPETENWDDDFEDSRNSPKKPLTMRSREENWDDEEDLDDETAEFGVFGEKEEDRTVTARSRRAALSRLAADPPPPLPQTHPFFVPNSAVPPLPNQPHAFSPYSPNSSVFSVPNTIGTYSSTAHLRPSSAFALLPPSPPIHRERERRRLKKKSRPRPQGMFELGTIPAGMVQETGPERFSFSDDGDASTSDHQRIRSETPKSDLETSSIDQPVPVPPLPATTLPSGLPPVPATPSKGTALLSRIGSVKRKWEARRRGASTTPSDVIDSQENDLQLTPRPQSSMSSIYNSASSHRHSTHASNLASNASPPTSSHWFFRASSAGSPRRASASTVPSSLSSAIPSTSSQPQPAPSRQTSFRKPRKSRSRSRSRTGAPESPSQQRDSGARLNGSSTSVNVVRQHERARLAMSTPSPDPRSLAGNTIPMPSTSTTTTPTKLIKRKSLGFVQLRRGLGGGHSGTGENEVLGKPPDMDDGERYGKAWVSRYSGLGLGRAGSSNKEGEKKEEGGEEVEERPRRKSFSRLLDRSGIDNSEPPSTNNTPPKEKEGSRGFLGSMRRLSLVSSAAGSAARHKRTKSGSGIKLSAPSQNSTSPPLLYSLPPLPASSSQISLRLPSVASSNGTNGGDSLFPASDASSRQVSAGSSIPPVPDLPPIPQETTRRRGSRSSRTSRKSLDGEGRRRSSSQTRPQPSSRRASLDQTIPALPKTPTRQPPPPLLPPIELQPPSPPRTVTKNRANTVTAGSAEVQRFAFDPLSPSLSSASTSAFFTPTSSPGPSNKEKLTLSPPLVARSPGSQQSASLGRSTPIKSINVSGAEAEGGGETGGASVPRRNSLGDLKIPARISQAQVGLKRDLGMVREFASHIDQLKDLQQSYSSLVSQVQARLDQYATKHVEELELTLPTSSPASPTPDSTSTRATSPGFFANLTRSKSRSRSRSNTNPTPSDSSSHSNARPAFTPSQIAYKDLATAFWSINSRHRISWECAELLIELGGAKDKDETPTSPPPHQQTFSPSSSQPTSAAALSPPAQYSVRERAMTLTREDDDYLTHKPAPLSGSSSLPATAFRPTPDVSSPSDATLEGPPANNSWKSSTGRNDLSHRQLVLLREMLNHTPVVSEGGNETQLSIPEETLPSAISMSAFGSMSQLQLHHGLGVVNRDWKWGDARNSTITLPDPSEEAFEQAERRRASADKERKRRSGRLGMIGIRDMLRAMKKNTSESSGSSNRATSPTAMAEYSRRGRVNAMSMSSTSLTTDSSIHSSHRYPHPRIPSGSGRKAKTSTGPDPSSISKAGARSTSPHQAPSFGPPKPSPRRPSLASIFRIGKNRPVSTVVDESPVHVSHPTPSDPPIRSASTTPCDELVRPDSAGVGTTEDSGSSTGEGEEDWDRMDSASDLDAAARALALYEGGSTVRLRKRRSRKSPYFQDSQDPPPLPHLNNSSLPSSNPASSRQSVVVQNRSFSASQTSLFGTNEPTAGSTSYPGSIQSSRPPRLSNVEEHPVAVSSKSKGKLTKSPSRPSSSRSNKPPPFGTGPNSPPALAGSPSLLQQQNTGSLRSMPPQLASMATLPDPSTLSLSMTPENIKPLLENAKVVLVKLTECIEEIRILLDGSQAQPSHLETNTFGHVGGSYAHNPSPLAISR